MNASNVVDFTSRIEAIQKRIGMGCQCGSPSIAKGKRCGACTMRATVLSPNNGGATRNPSPVCGGTPDHGTPQAEGAPAPRPASPATPRPSPAQTNSGAPARGLSTMGAPMQHVGAGAPQWAASAWGWVQKNKKPIAIGGAAVSAALLLVALVATAHEPADVGLRQAEEEDDD